MPLPTDNETEGVIDTAAPIVGIGGLVIPTLNSPLVVAAPPATVEAPYFMPFRKVMRESWLWLTCALALLIFVVAYQFFPDYNMILYRGVISSYSSTQMRLGDGWQPPNSTQPSANPSLQTTDSGSIYLPNFGYAIGFGSYQLDLLANAAQPLSYTISIDNQLIGTYHAYNGGNTFVNIPASAFLNAGPHPSIYFRILPSNPTQMGTDKPILHIFKLHVSAPSLLVIAIPPMLTLLCVLLIALLCGLEVRRSYSPSQSAFRVMGISLAIYISLLFIWLHPSQRLDLVSNLLWSILFLSASVVITWRRELANWILHLRHPGDERFIVR